MYIVIACYNYMNNARPEYIKYSVLCDCCVAKSTVFEIISMNSVHLQSNFIGSVIQTRKSTVEKYRQQY